MFNKKKENKRKLEEINKRLDAKADILYFAYKNKKLDLNKLNDDMKKRILELEKNDKILDKTKVNKIKEALDNIDKNEDKEEGESTKYIVTKYNDFKTI